jgi:hypothetical protein
MAFRYALQDNREQEEYGQEVFTSPTSCSAIWQCYGRVTTMIAGWDSWECARASRGLLIWARDATALFKLGVL